MVKQYQIRADYDRDTIVIYQAYSEKIAQRAIEHQTFVSPFSFNRMTWIKPSFLWLMYRSNWAQKSNQEYILAVRITRQGWEDALKMGVLTGYEKSVYANPNAWRKQFNSAKVHIQWDPERSIKGSDLQTDSIQVGLSRHIIRQFVYEWVVSIDDYTPLVKKIRNLLKKGDMRNAKKLLPKEQVYKLPSKHGKHLMIQD